MVSAFQNRRRNNENLDLQDWRNRLQPEWNGCTNAPCRARSLREVDRARPSVHFLWLGRRVRPNRARDSGRTACAHPCTGPEGRRKVSDKIETHPVQARDRNGFRRDGARCPTVVTLAAYEVYSEVYAPQPALVTGHCRGGFGMGELVAFLY